MKGSRYLITEYISNYQLICELSSSCDKSRQKREKTQNSGLLFFNGINPVASAFYRHRGHSIVAIVAAEHTFMVAVMEMPDWLVFATLC